MDKQMNAEDINIYIIVLFDTWFNLHIQLLTACFFNTTTVN